MYEKMVAKDGVGLATPQVVIIDIEDENGLIELINPEVTLSEGKEIDIEGCLSIP